MGSEHSFSKKKGYATTFCDLAKHNIFDVVPGKSSTDLSGYLNTLPGKERVKVVCIDLSTSYRNIVRQHFPNAMIVADLSCHSFSQSDGDANLSIH